MKKYQGLTTFFLLMYLTSLMSIEDVMVAEDISHINVIYNK